MLMSFANNKLVEQARLTEDVLHVLPVQGSP